MGARVGAFIKLEFNKEELSKDYIITPYKYKTKNGEEFEEFEEQTNKPVKNPFKYITKVILLKSAIDNLIYFEWNREEGITSNTEYKYINIQSRVKLIKEICDKRCVELFVQSENRIAKDDKYINSIINYPVIKILYGYLYVQRGFTYDKTNSHLNDDIYDIYTGKQYFSIQNDDPRLVIGFDYANLRLFKNILTIKNNSKINLKTQYNKNKFDLYELKFIIEKEDIIKEDDDSIYVKKARLKRAEKL